MVFHAARRPRGTELPVLFLNRPVKPFAFWMSLALFSLVVINIVDVGVFGSMLVGDVVAACAMAGSVALWCGWWYRSQLLSEVGLLLATGVWMTRAAFIALTVGLNYYGTYLSICWAGASGGAYLLERYGPRK